MHVHVHVCGWMMALSVCEQEREWRIGWTRHPDESRDSRERCEELSSYEHRQRVPRPESGAAGEPRPGGSTLVSSILSERASFSGKSAAVSSSLQNHQAPSLLLSPTFFSDNKPAQGSGQEGGRVG